MAFPPLWHAWTGRRSSKLPLRSLVRTLNAEHTNITPIKLGIVQYQASAQRLNAKRALLVSHQATGLQRHQSEPVLWIVSYRGRIRREADQARVRAGGLTAISA